MIKEREQFVELLKSALAVYPELRIGQMLSHIVNESERDTDAFYEDDKNMCDRLKHYIKGEWF